MPDRYPTTWKIKPHTEAKHQVLREYLGAWLPKLTWANRTVFIDGFAGPGEYLGGEPGSPIVALDTTIGHLRLSSECERIFVFIEERLDRYSNLQELLQDKEEAEEIPTNIRVMARHGTFEEYMGEVLESLGEGQLAPALIMVDPFGPKGMPYQLIAKLAAFKYSELLVSLMYESFSRWLATPEFEKHLDLLYGRTDWRRAITMGPQQRKYFMHDLYVEQLQAAGMKYVRSLEMFDAGSRTEYFLIFATHHLLGLEAMKAAMWKVDPSGRYQFSDATNRSQPTLFKVEPDFEPLREAILGEFAGRTVGIRQIEAFVLTDTPFMKSHVRTHALIPLQDEEDLEVDRYGFGSTPFRTHAFPKGTRVRFAS